MARFDPHHRHLGHVYLTPVPWVTYKTTQKNISMKESLLFGIAIQLSRRISMEMEGKFIR